MSESKCAREEEEDKEISFSILYSLDLIVFHVYRILLCNILSSILVHNLKINKRPMELFLTLVCVGHSAWRILIFLLGLFLKWVYALQVKGQQYPNPVSPHLDSSLPFYAIDALSLAIDPSSLILRYRYLLVPRSLPTPSPFLTQGPLCCPLVRVWLRDLPSQFQPNSLVFMGILFQV